MESQWLRNRSDKYSMAVDEPCQLEEKNKKPEEAYGLQPVAHKCPASDASSALINYASDFKIELCFGSALLISWSH